MCGIVLIGALMWRRGHLHRNVQVKASNECRVKRDVKCWYVAAQPVTSQG